MLGDEINDDLANTICAQLLFLEHEDPTKDITLYINSPGGSVTASLAIQDTMAHVKPHISTICTGQAAGTALLLLAAGARGKRFCVPDARLVFVPLLSHRPHNAPDARVASAEMKRLSNVFFEAFSRHTGRATALIQASSERADKVSPRNAVAMGLIDGVFKAREGGALESPRAHPEPHASSPEMEQAFERATEPDAGAAARVLADWLQSKGDRRGELASLHQSGHAVEAETYLKRYAQALLGDLDVALIDELDAFEWRQGFLSGLSVRGRINGDRSLAALTREVLELPIARFVTKLRIGPGHERDDDWSETVRAVVECTRSPMIRELAFHLHASARLHREEMELFVSCNWPSLERLDISFGAGQDNLAGVLTLLNARSAPALKHLALRNLEAASSMLPELLASPLLKQLEVLSLAGCPL